MVHHVEEIIGFDEHVEPRLLGTFGIGAIGGALTMQQARARWTSPGAQRIPGMDERWQQEDLAWRPVTLGLDGDRPPPVLGPGEDPVGPIEPRTPLGSADGDDPGHSRDVRGEPPVSPGPDAAWPAEDHNPLPPGEEPEDGPL